MEQQCFRELNSNRLNGAFDDVRIYSEALSGAQVASLYNAPVPEPSTALLLGGWTGGAGDATKATNADSVNSLQSS